MIKTLSAYWHFLKRPELLKLSKDKKTLVKDFYWLLLLDLLFVAIVFSIYYGFSHFRIIKEYKEEVDVLKKYGIYGALFIGGIIAPLTEEFLFRWHLRKRYFTIYFVCFSMALIVGYFIHSSYLNWPIFIVFLIISLILHSYFKRISTTRKQRFWMKLYPYIFYYTALVFGLVHLTNIKGLTLADPAFLFFVSSQVFGGLSMGYLRIKHGLIYSILFHACFNLIAILLEFFFS